jgi:hypothetical protein
MIDGSGLDRANRVTCEVLLSTVRSQRVDGPFFKGLSVMGEYGTLRKRLRGTPAQGIVHAKTGSLNGVSSLTGFAQTADQTEAHFAMVFNELASTGDGVRAGNAIAESIVAFPSAPELNEFSLPGQIPQAKPLRQRPTPDTAAAPGTTATTNSTSATTTTNAADNSANIGSVDSAGPDNSSATGSATVDPAASTPATGAVPVPETAAIAPTNTTAPAGN